MAVNGRLFELLAEAKAQPSGAFKDASAAIGAADQATKSYSDYKTAEKMHTKLSDILGDPQYGNITLGDVANKNSGLLELMKIRSENGDAPVNTVDMTDPSNPVIKKIGTAPRHAKFVDQPKPDIPGSLDAILAENVRTGKMTMDQAAKVKRSFSPSIIEKPPVGYESVPGGGGLRPIPGGPAFVKTEDEAKKAQTAVDAQNQDANLVIGKIDSALSKVNNLSAGVGSYTKGIPGTPAMNLSGDLDTILSSLGLGKLMEMKNNSKAGASGMGQLSDKEMNLLTSSLSSLKQAQSPEQLTQHLNEVKTHYQNVLKMNQGVNPFGNTGAVGVDPHDQAAMDWLNANPNAPTAGAVRGKLRAKGLLK